MQRVFAAGISLATLFCVPSARAFAPSENGVVEEQTVRPPPQVAITHGLSVLDASGDGSVSFLGRAKLPVARFAAQSTGAANDAVATYFATATGNAVLQLKHLSETTQGDNTLLGFVQTINGVPIAGTYALAQIQGDAVRYARAFLVRAPALSTDPRIDAAAAIDAAQADVMAFAGDANVAQQPMLVVAYHQDQAVLAWQVQVASAQGSWNEFINATSGAFEMRQKASFDAVSGSINAPVEPTCQGDTPQVTALPYVQWVPGRATNGNGEFSSPVGYTQAQVMLNGAFFRIYSYDGYTPAWNFGLAGAPADNELSLGNAPLSQTDPYYYASQARAWVRARAAGVPELSQAPLWSWTMSQLPMKVNFASGSMGYSCNAFYDGQSLNFYQADSRMGCNNSGRAGKIVYHEYGHGIHDHLTANASTFDHQVSEGAADYVAASMTNDPTITGLMGCNQVLRGRNTLRTCVNKYTYCNSRKCTSFPGDEPHNSAPVMCGALWELRTALTNRYGQDAGRLKADQLFLRFLSLASDMGSTYAAAIAADEDTDNDPSNGTVHSCEINKAFLGNGTGDFAHFPDQVGQRVPCVSP